MSNIFGDVVLGDSDSPTSTTAGDVNDWATYTPTPTTTSPPLVAATVPSTTSGSGASTAGGAIASLLTGAAGIFGRAITPQPLVPVVQPTPLWVYALLGIGGVVVLGVVARSLRNKKRRVAGYGRHHRKNRRSRR